MAILACVALALSLVATATASSKTAAESTLSTASTPALASITTAPIYLPGYNNESWKPVRGSIIGSSGNETTYTIFCPSATPIACDLDGEFPFVIVNGPSTVRFSGTITSKSTANLGCDLVGTTEATCSGYSSHRPPEFNMGKGVVSTRPDELSWTSTLTGSAVQWGTLTLADVPATATDGSGSDGSATGSPTAATSNIFYYTPQPASGGDMVRPGAWLMAGLVVLVLGI